MRKNLLLLSVAICSFATFAQSLSPVAQWGEIMTTNASTGGNNTAVAYGDDGVAYWLDNMNTTESAPDILLNTDVIATGEAYNSGTSSTSNLVLLATDDKGDKKWMIQSTLGDFASAQGNVAVDSEGNVIFTAKVRPGDFLTQPVTIVDASGKKFEVGGAVDKRSYNVLVAKANSNGDILWLKYIKLNTTPTNTAQDFVADAVKVPALAVDTNDNIYVGGNYSAEMTVGNVKLPAVNIGDAKVDTQTSTGAMFVLKFDADGNCVKSAVAAEGNTQSKIDNFEFADGKVYFFGTVTGGTDLAFAGKTVAAGENQSPVFGCLDTDLSATWMTSLKGEKVGTACVIQSSGISVVNNTLWLAGMFNGKFSDRDNSANYVASNAQTPREGMILKLSASDGSWIAATTSKASNFAGVAANNITGYFKILQNEEKPEKCYAFGYVMNANVGIVLREYDANTLEANLDHAWSLATGGGVPSCTSIAFDKATANAYVAGRGNNAFTLLADPAITTVKPAKWGVLMSKFTMPADLLSGISDISVSEEAEKSEYFNLQGMRISNPSAGIYIRRCGNKVEKVYVK